MTHNHLGNLQLVSQYLTILGSLALALHDNGQAREILKSSLTLAKKLYDVPTQIWVLSVLTSISDLLILLNFSLSYILFGSRYNWKYRKRVVSTLKMA